MGQLFLQLWQLLSSHKQDLFHCPYSESLWIGGRPGLREREDDPLVAPLWASASPNIDKFGQARRAHEFFHQSAKVFPKQFGTSLQDAQGIVTTCPQGQGGGLGPGVNLHGLGPCSCGKLM